MEIELEVFGDNLLDYEICQFREGPGIWAAIKQPNGESNIILIYFDFYLEQGWLASRIHEEMSPIAKNCPLRLLDLTTQNESNWRQSVRNYWATIRIKSRYSIIILWTF